MNLKKARANEPRLTLADAARSGHLGGTNALGLPPQIEGGARALGWKCGAVADANSAWGRSVTKLAEVGSGRADATEGVEVPVNLISAQIGQSKSANPLRTGSRELDSSEAGAADASAVSVETGTRGWT